MIPINDPTLSDIEERKLADTLAPLLDLWPCLPLRHPWNIPSTPNWSERGNEEGYTFSRGSGRIGHLALTAFAC